MKFISPDRDLQSVSRDPEFPSLNVFLLGRRITCMTVPAMIEGIHTACKTNSRLTIGSYNIHSFNLSMIHPWFYDYFQKVDIAMCDGIGILKAIQYMGLKLPLPYRVTYTVLIPEVLRHCDQQGFSVFLLGAAQDHVSAAVKNLSKQYPSMEVNSHHGFFDMNDPQQNEAVIQAVNKAKPNVVMVGMGNPRQEEWIRLHGDRLNANVIMLGGAVIKRLGGVTSDCPQWISDMGLEWFYRLCQEPRRLGTRYLIGNPAFALQVILGKAFGSTLKVEPMLPMQNILRPISELQAEREKTTDRYLNLR
jgi:N-acetylglucosaminyldiphosphoundecaprenol N-acetyl-beta-D-mannosaminyltransferase